MAQTSGLRILKDLSYEIGDDNIETQSRLFKLVTWVFQHKYITRTKAKDIMGADTAAGNALVKLREKGVLRVEGQKRGARWVFTEEWVGHDHEVSGEAFSDVYGG